VAARDKCDAVSLPDQTHLTPHISLQLLPVSPLTWKSYQSLQQVMPLPTAGRLCHLRWRTHGVKELNARVRSKVEPLNACFDALLIHRIHFLLQPSDAEASAKPVN